MNRAWLVLGYTGLMLVTGCSPPPTGLLAETVYLNGIVITMDGDQVVEAVAVRGDEIIAVGSNDEVEELVGTSTEVCTLTIYLKNLKVKARTHMV